MAPTQSLQVIMKIDDAVFVIRGKWTLRFFFFLPADLTVVTMCFSSLIFILSVVKYDGSVQLHQPSRNVGKSFHIEQAYLSKNFFCSGGGIAQW